MHVSAETLECDTCRDTEPPRIEHGPDVSAETARRLACDAGIVTMTHAPDGSVLDVGRRRRSPTTAIRRALAHRDGTCRFPSCRVRFCESHHVTGWTKGGKTKLTNLLLLCRRHHRLLHEGGWSVEFRDGGEVVFHRADGRPVPRIPDRPAVHSTPLRALEHANDRLGLRIDPWTVTPDWDGDRIDVDWALGVLRGPVRVAEPEVPGLLVLAGGTERTVRAALRLFRPMLLALQGTHAGSHRGGSRGWIGESPDDGAAGEPGSP